MSRQGKAAVCLLVLCLASWLVAVGAEAPAKVLKVQLKPTVLLSGEAIRLEAVADLSGPEELLAKAKKVVLGPLPPVGQQLVLPVGYVAMKLRAQGLGDKQLEFGPVQRCLVSTASHYVDQQQVLEAIKARLKTNQVEGVEQVGLAKPFEAVAVPQGKLQLDVEAPLELADGDYARLLVKVDGKQVKAFLLKLTGIAGAPSAQPSNTNPKPPVGQPVVRYGSPVQLVVRGKNFSITAAGVCQGTARVGEVVKVKNQSSGRLVQGMVEAPGIVVINLEEGS